ncbi:major capsid protein [Bartonella sp. HY038]|uniref:major capsid protein n=1 Tax=Bartonella sp. HY038 TaxID=2759660 RepID=UPI0015F8E01D|nr:major capsid protein [Bartonella sp. HY038]
MDPLFNTADLCGVVATVRVAPSFFLDRYFRSAPKFSTQENIIFDEILEGLPVMAPFVSPLVAAKPQQRAGFTVKSFKPAYVKPKHQIKPSDFVSRLPGEALTGELSIEERRNREIVRLIAEQKRQIYARWEWMAAQAIINGKVEVSGEDYPAQIVDFGRDKNNEIIISADAQKWINENVDIDGLLEDWSLQLLTKSGYAGTDLIMSPEVWKSFRKNKGVLRNADLRRGITSMPDLQPKIAQDSVRYVGQYGEFSLYVYAGRFRDQDGNETRALLAGEVILTAAPNDDGQGGAHGVKVFGAIQDVQAGLVATDIFPKSWIQQDPSAEYIMSQSAPLMVPGRPNATLKATVL